MIRLGVNIDHVATIRQARRATEPDPVAAAVIAMLSGADNITLHLREDRRHIQDRDLRVMREVIHNNLNLEMAATDEMLEIACSVKPDQATLVPERREELTTEGGLNIIAYHDVIANAIERLKAKDIHLSLFIDPDLDQVDISKRLGADAVELQTATYSEAKTFSEKEKSLEKLRAATEYAISRGLHVHMGHGLNYHNVQAITAIAGVEELNIGHSIISRAVLVGLATAVREMKEAMHQSS